MPWDALNPKQLAGLRVSLNRHHAALSRILGRLERAGLSPADNPLYQHIAQAADSIADARSLLRSRQRPK